ncbi:MAG: SDR family oxidoreductase [Bacteroidales bacterium]|nr:SDR family oxidoreductase [Bacteroidales bacterium]
MEKKVVVITGASSGIGKALAEVYASKNYQVVMAARNKAKLDQIAEEIQKSASSEVFTIKTDVSIQKDCESLIDQTIAHFGQIDVLINNAGISMRALFKDVDLEVIKKLMDVNFWGTVYCTKYAMPHLLKSKGTVVGVISIAGYIGLPARSGYGASKYAVRGFLDTLRVENLHTGLNVLVVAPGFTSSNIRNVALTADGSMQGETPRDETKMMSSEAVALKIFNAVKKKRKELILTFIEGKFTVFLNKWAPRLMDKLAYNHMAKEPNSPLS